MTTSNQRLAIDALKAIARGQPRYGSPLPRETARQIARQALVRMHEHWGPRQTGEATDAPGRKGNHPATARAAYPTRR